MRKIVYVCDKCGKVIQKNPIGIVPVVLQEDKNIPEEIQPEKYTQLNKLQFCSDCADKFVKYIMNDTEEITDSFESAILNAEEDNRKDSQAVEKKQSVVEEKKESQNINFLSLDELMAKYSDLGEEKTEEAGIEPESDSESQMEPELEKNVVSEKIISEKTVPEENDERKKELIDKLAECVVDMDEEGVVKAAKTYISEGYSAFDGIYEGLLVGMNKASDLFDAEEYFVTDILLCSDTMYAGLDILRPYLPVTSIDEKGHKVIIGVVEGDTHDIGKNLVKIMLETAGFEVVDLGRDVPLDEFVDKAIEENASIICMSTLMTTTMGGMKTVIDKLTEKGVRDRFKVMIGGSPISQKYADEIGADGYTANAVEAVSLAKRFIGMSDKDVVIGM